MGQGIQGRGGGDSGREDAGTAPARVANGIGASRDGKIGGKGSKGVRARLAADTGSAASDVPEAVGATTTIGMVHGVRLHGPARVPEPEARIHGYQI